MRIVSWNVHRCFGVDGRYEPERVAKALASLQADVIALQEIDSSLKTSDGRDQLSYIASVVGMESVMGPTLHRDYGAYGNAILTKHEIISCEEYDLSYRKFEPRGALAAGIRHGDVCFRLVNTHLGLKYWERAFQIDRVLSGIVWKQEPLAILLGDFNEWFPFTANNLRLQRSFGHRAPRLATFPSTWPRFALDRIYLSGPVENLLYHTPQFALARMASDHLPLVADFSPSVEVRTSV